MSEPNNNEEKRANPLVRAAFALAAVFGASGCVAYPVPAGHHGGGWGGYQAPRAHVCGHTWSGRPIYCR